MIWALEFAMDLTTVVVDINICICKAIRFAMGMNITATTAVPKLMYQIICETQESGNYLFSFHRTYRILQILEGLFTTAFGLGE